MLTPVNVRTSKTTRAFIHFLLLPHTTADIVRYANLIFPLQMQAVENLRISNPRFTYSDY